MFQNFNKKYYKHHLCKNPAIVSKKLPHYATACLSLSPLAAISSPALSTPTETALSSGMTLSTGETLSAMPSTVIPSAMQSETAETDF